MKQKNYILQHKYLENPLRTLALAGFFGLIALFVFSYPSYKKVYGGYVSLLSARMNDRHGETFSMEKNAKGYLATEVEKIPDTFKKLLIKKEDRFFYLHPGINPGSIIREVATLAFTGKRYGASTLTQQLVKNILGNEMERTLWNKITEAWYALVLELWTNKAEILKMYADSAYFGNKAQGLVRASEYYFNKTPDQLTEGEVVSLLATLNAPSYHYPGTRRNQTKSARIASALGAVYHSPTTDLSPTAQSPGYPDKLVDASFELNSLNTNCHTPACAFTIDAALTKSLRSILRQHLLSNQFESAENGAIVVIKLPENELLAIIGSPNPLGAQNGAQINMALAPRAIGSTAKPFFYLKAFEKGLRPYSMVEDKEYIYTIGTGYEFYPKNYDGRYRGTVSVREALSNSLNVPSVKVLEYAGINEFAEFLTETLMFKPVQPIEEYSLGIALGGLEMDLATLAHLYTIFPNQGLLKPLITGHRSRCDCPVHYTPPMLDTLADTLAVAQSEHIALINNILSDRAAAADQFGIKSYLNLSRTNYALKTGTSRDYHDSWTIGYTPDFLVGVWIGNSDERPMRIVSGQSGAGRVWHDVMEVLLNSEYNIGSHFDFSALAEFRDEKGNLDYGLANDDYKLAKNIMLEPQIILRPHQGDTIILDPATAVPLEARTETDWFVNGSLLGRARKIYWEPIRPGEYKVVARTNGQEETVVVKIVDAGFLAH